MEAAGPQGNGGDERDAAAHQPTTTGTESTYSLVVVLVCSGILNPNSIGLKFSLIVFFLGGGL